MSILSKRYAKALLSQAKEEKVERLLYLDIKYLKILYKNNLELITIFNNYNITPEKKKQIILSITSNKISSLTIRFLNLLQSKKRFSILVDICSDFLEMYNEEKKLKTVYLTTTFKVSQSTLTGLRENMKKILDCDDIKIVLRIDKSLKGGYILKYEDQQIDNSIKSKFEKLKLTLLKNL